jgi:deoxyribodipyrimidine photolyase-related protein
MADRIRNMVLVLGDQLTRAGAQWDGFDPSADAVWMAEADGEADHVWSTQPRLVMFLSAMRHFRDGLRSDGMRVHYGRMDDPANTGTLAGELKRAVRSLGPGRLIVARPGEWRVLHSLRTTAGELGVELDVREDEHFLSTPGEFDEWAEGRKELRMENWYRPMRRRLGVLIDGDGRPAGGTWNLDGENRDTFGRGGPSAVPAGIRFDPDETTREVIRLVRERYADRPGDLDEFAWPVTGEQAREALEDFIAHRLVKFGPYQDAMWLGRPWLWHARLSAAMNLHLLDPRDVVAEAEEACRRGDAPLNSVEGFVRQVIGWREYVRGVYWRFMPGYLGRNALEAEADLPGFYWTGQTEAACLRECIGQTLRLGYAHHIQRLMVTGLFAMLLGVRPEAVHEWYLAVYVDAVEWVELPNTLGMSQYGDGGVMVSKPYAASGKYIRRMSNYCSHCPYDPADATGDTACPFTCLYWAFLMRQEKRLAGNPRMCLQLRNLAKLSAGRKSAISRRANRLRERLSR